MLKNKANNKKGFTLAELLIVVAIIGILVAVSMPILTNQLNKSKEATDNANLRAAKAAAVAEALDVDSTLKKDGATAYYYNIETGKIVSTKPEDYGVYGAHTVIKVVINADGTVNVNWEPTSE